MSRFAPHGPDEASDAVLALLVEELTDRLQAGEAVDLEAYIGRHPERADQLRRLLPALEMLAVAGSSAHGREPSREPAAEGPGLVRGVLGDFLILREVGRGGMGVVYEAEQVSLGRRVALKVLPLHACGDGKALERFRREARAAAKLHHTNIVPVHEIGQDGDVCFYAMQFIQGRSLDQIIEELRRLRAQAPPGDGPPLAESAPAPGADSSRPAVDRLAQSLLTGRFQGDGAPVTPALPSGAAAPLTSRTEGYAPAPAVADTTSTLASDPTSSAVVPRQTDLSCVRTNRHHYFQSVARIGFQAAHALAHAHARQIIHRDVKPSNLLLDTAGVVWAIPRMTSKTFHTMSSVA
jgi:hypothetical protein